MAPKSDARRRLEPETSSPSFRCEDITMPRFILPLSRALSTSWFVVSLLAGTAAGVITLSPGVLL